MARHKHDYQTQRTVERIVDGKRKIFSFQRCMAPGECSKRDRVVIKNA